MTITRILGLVLLLVLLTRLLPLLAPILGEHWRQRTRRLIVTLDVAGGLIVLVIIGSVLLRGDVLSALLVAVLGLPVFWGAYRALPAWWRGID